MLDQRVSAGGLRDWAPRAFGDFARVRPLHAVGTRGYPWTEIDFPEDYERAVREILPAIEATTRPGDARTSTPRSSTPTRPSSCAASGIGRTHAAGIRGVTESHMYERFYRLRERPFALTPDPDYLYPSRVHKEALSYLRYGIESHAGFVVITGAIGSGKTTLLQTMLRGLDGQTTVARVMNTLLDPRELLESAMIDLGLDPGASRSRRC